MITAKIAVATSPKKKTIFKRTSTEQNVIQKLKRQKLAQKKLMKNVELDKLVTDQGRFESRARVEQDSKHSAPFKTEDEAKFQTNYYTSIIYKRVHIEKSTNTIINTIS